MNKPVLNKKLFHKQKEDKHRVVFFGETTTFTYFVQEKKIKLSYEKFKANFHCVGGRHHSAIYSVEGDVAETSQK